MTSICACQFFLFFCLMMIMSLKQKWWTTSLFTSSLLELLDLIPKMYHQGFGSFYLNRISLEGIMDVMFRTG